MYILLLAGFFFTGMGVWATFNPSDPIFLKLPFFLLGSLVLGWFSLTFATQSNQVTTHGMRQRSIWGERFLRWDNTWQIAASTAYDLGPFIGLTISLLPYGDDRSSIDIMVAFYGNRHQLAKAIAEAAVTANPKVVVSPRIIETYGPPPYGLETLTR